MSGSKRTSVSDELLYAWVDGEAGARTAEVRDLVDNDPSVAAKADNVRYLGREVVSMVDAAIGPEQGPDAVDTLYALSKIRERIAERKSRTVRARVQAWWADVLLFHRKALAGVAVAAGLGALSAPGVVWLARDRVAPAQPSPAAVATSVTVESLQVDEGKGKATVLQNDGGTTTLIWVEPTGESPHEN